MAMEWGDFWSGLVQNILTAGAGYAVGKLTGTGTTQTVSGTVTKATTSTEKKKNTLLYAIGAGFVILLAVLLVKK